MLIENGCEAGTLSKSKEAGFPISLVPERPGLTDGITRKETGRLESLRLEIVRLGLQKPVPESTPVEIKMEPSKQPSLLRNIAVLSVPLVTMACSTEPLFNSFFATTPAASAARAMVGVSLLFGIPLAKRLIRSFNPSTSSRSVLRKRSDEDNELAKTVGAEQREFDMVKTSSTQSIPKAVDKLVLGTIGISVLLGAAGYAGYESQVFGWAVFSLMPLAGSLWATKH
jgi:hypothetical protein